MQRRESGFDFPSEWHPSVGMELRQRAPLEGEVKSEIADDDTRMENVIPRRDLLRFVDQFKNNMNDQVEVGPPTSKTAVALVCSCLWGAPCMGAATPWVLLPLGCSYPLVLLRWVLLPLGCSYPIGCSYPLRFVFVLVELLVAVCGAGTDSSGELGT